MTKPLYILASVAALVVLLASSVVGAAPAPADSSGVAPAAAGIAPADPAPEVAPDRLVAGQAAGGYYLDYGNTRLSPSQYPVRGAIHFYSWSNLQQGPNAYNWSALNAWINDRFSLGLSTGIFVSTYDGDSNGDILATPNFVIETPNAVVVTAEYVDYLRRENGNFDSWGPTAGWSLFGGAAIVNTSPLNATYVGQLGGANDITDQRITHDVMQTPAMPPPAVWPGGTKMEMQFDYYVQTTDAKPNADHLYVEIVDPSGNLIALVADITNTSGANNVAVTSPVYNLSSYNVFARSLRVRFRATTDGSDPTTFYIDEVKLRVRHLVPKYWEATYQNLYRNFITELGNQLRANSKVDFVSIGVGLYGETQPVDVWTRGGVMKQEMIKAGLTSEKWVQTVNTITDMYVSAFSTGTTLRKNLLLQYAPYFDRVSERIQFTDYAVGRGVGLSSNNLMPELDVAFHPLGQGGFDPITKNARYNFIPIAFETYVNYACSPVFFYWAVLNGLSMHADYLRFDPDLLRKPDGTLTANGPTFQWAKEYWGRTVQNTPSVWTVMREHRNPTPYCYAPNDPTYSEPGKFSTYPILGNFNFWLYQDDTIAGGKTVPETNDPGADSRPQYAGGRYPSAGLGNCPYGMANAYSPTYPCNPTPYNPNLPPLEGQNPTRLYDPRPWTGNGKEAWVVRRTDQNSDPAKNNPYMWFEIDDQYIDGTQIYSVVITVKYFDIGNDKWSLKYDSTSNEKAAEVYGSGGRTYVQKTNTRQLKEAKFLINDGKFANRLGGGRADFYIDSRSPEGVNDGNEWIHMVDVAKGSSISEPTPTPTATATPTETPTPTVTPTATPTTGVVEGVTFHDKNNNGVQDADEPGLPGAELGLWQGSDRIYTAVSGADGVFRFPAVAPGQYQLREDVAPPGYLRYPMPVLLVVNANQTLPPIYLGHQLAPTPTPTPTLTPTSTPTLTPTPTFTPTPTPTETPTPTPTPTPTETPTPTPTPTLTPTPTPWRLYLPMTLKLAGGE